MYLDDIVVYSKSLEEHIGHIRRNLTLFNDAGATLRLKNCKFFIDKNDYRGLVIRPRCVEISSHTTDDICGPQSPKNLTEL